MFIKNDNTSSSSVFLHTHDDTCSTVEKFSREVL